MQLSFNVFDAHDNLIPYDGELYYIQNCISVQQANMFFKKLNEYIIWERDEFNMYGKRIISKRKVAWYGAKRFDYGYSGIRRKARPWTRELFELKEIIEGKSLASFNTCLLNFYHNGLEGMGWHSDNEKELQPGATIASLSLGVARKFSFKHKESKETISINLANGSLLLMKGAIQKHWLHQLPKSKRIIDPRINLTFRSIIDET